MLRRLGLQWESYIALLAWSVHHCDVILTGGLGLFMVNEPQVRQWWMTLVEPSRPLQLQLVTHSGQKITQNPWVLLHAEWQAFDAMLGRYEHIWRHLTTLNKPNPGLLRGLLDRDMGMNSILKHCTSCNLSPWLCILLVYWFFIFAAGTDTSKYTYLAFECN